jgi:hypothetical protein
MKDYDKDRYTRYVVSEMATLDCGSARFGDPVDGDPVALVTYMLDDDVVKASLPLKDCRQLVRGLLDVLVEFDDEAAARGLKAMFPDEPSD